MSEGSRVPRDRFRSFGGEHVVEDLQAVARPIRYRSPSIDRIPPGIPLCIEDKTWLLRCCIQVYDTGKTCKRVHRRGWPNHLIGPPRRPPKAWRELSTRCLAACGEIFRHPAPAKDVPH